MALGPLTKEDSLASPVSIAKGAVAGSVLFTSLLGFNALQMASLVLRPVAREPARRLNRWAADTWWGLCVDLAEQLHHFEVVASGDPLPPEENAVVVANHQQMTDIVVIMALARQKGRLGDLKFFVKDAMKWVPGVGWGMVMLDFPFLKRNWADDRGTIERTFEGLMRERVPAWLINFAEGTRLTAPKHARSNAYAREHGLPELRNVLHPRPKGFAAAVTGLRQHATAVYDLTLGYERGVPSLGQYVVGAVQRVHLHVRRYPMETMPVDEDALGEWVRQRWLEKDARLERFYASGTLEADEREQVGDDGGS